MCNDCSSHFFIAAPLNPQHCLQGISKSLQIQDFHGLQLNVKGQTEQRDVYMSSKDKLPFFNCKRQPGTEQMILQSNLQQNGFGGGLDG